MTEIEQIQTFINSISQIDKDQLDSFCDKRKLTSITKGKILVHAGDLAQKLFFLHKGVFRYYIISPDGKDITKDFAIDERNPFCMAYSSFMTNQPSQIYIEALTNSKVSVWDRTYFFPLVTQNIHWLPFSQRITMGMFIRKEKKEISLIRDSALQRYLDFQKEFPCLLGRIPQHYIASYLNIAPESLSRIKRNPVS